jgi:CheY-like chemotaxis protein
MLTDLSFKNILIVDDEPDSINVVQLVCEYHGAKVKSTNSAKECLKMLEEGIPDIVFMDIQMPIMSGWEAIKHIRENSQLGGLPVIAMTAHAMDGDKQRVLNAGFTGYMSKPISPMSFLEDIESILQAEGNPK